MAAPVNLLELSHGFIVSHCISIAAQLKLHLVISRPMTCEEIAQETKTHAPTLKHLLDVLLAYEILVKDDSDKYLPAPSLNQLELVLSLYNGHVAFQVWEHALHSVRTGEPAWDKKFGKNFNKNASN